MVNFRILGGIGILLLFLFSAGFTPNSLEEDDNGELNSVILPPYLEYLNDAWVDSVMQSLTPKERIAQLIMAPLYSNKSLKSQQKVVTAIKEYNLGGIIFFQGDPLKQAVMINSVQKISKTPLVVATDAEWGLGMRLKQTLNYPYNIDLGAIQNDTLLYDMGRDLGEQCRMVGVHINFAPVVDVNNNPSNPVIGFRSYGEDPDNVGRKASWFTAGIQSERVLAVAKHFPGHGDTSVDSHLSLPVITHKRARLDSVEFVPFKTVINSGIGGVMSAHLNLPNIEPEKGLPSTLSSTILTGILREDLNYKGIVFTDAMNMKGLTSHFAAGKVEPMALKAGNDMLETVTDPKLAIEGIVSAIGRGELSQELIDSKCRKILAMKRWCGLNKYAPVDVNKIVKRLHAPKYQKTVRELSQASITVIKNNSDLIPIKKIGEKRIAVVMLGQSSETLFKESCSKYSNATQFSILKKATPAQLSALYKKLDEFDIIIAGVDGLSKYASKKFAVSESQKSAISHIAKSKKGILVIFGNPYALGYMRDIEYAESIVLAGISSKEAHRSAAHLIFGAASANGKLSVTVDDRFRVGMGEDVDPLGRLKSSIPEEIGIDSKKLIGKIDSIAFAGIQNHAFPGCQVVVVKDKNIIVNKGYGYHTYNNKRKVRNSDLYDWASVTKVSGPLPLLMQMVDRGEIDLDKPMSDYWPRWRGTDKEGLILRDILTHQAKLKPYIPYWNNLVKGDTVASDPLFYRGGERKGYPVRVSMGLRAKAAVKDSVYNVIDRSELFSTKKYRYSGLAFLIFPEMITKVTGLEYEKYFYDSICAPIGAGTVVYNPLNRFPKGRIVPTEVDKVFRKETLKGYVHDESASLFGGVAGNAGLFGTAEDCAKIFQLYLDEGEYGGERIISKERVNEFTKRQFPNGDNRRGLGFDKPLVDNKSNRPRGYYPAYSSSEKSFGHTGYTGNIVWADPENDLIFILLSNRVYPTRENGKITKMNIRSGMHQAIYNAINI